MEDYTDMRVGLLALQGDFERHAHQVRLVGAAPVEVRSAADFEQIDALIIPGGESTTMHYLMEKFGLRRPLLEFARSHPVFGTCAGMILLSTDIQDNQAGIVPLKLLDIGVLRNDYGRQIYSFQDALPARLNGKQVDLTATFIRAPRIVRVGAGVEILAEYRDDPVLVKKGFILACSFHTELDDDTRLLKYFLSLAGEKGDA
jgi:5'-phosphate synthase pdxT subunit